MHSRYFSKFQSDQCPIEKVSFAMRKNFRISLNIQLFSQNKQDKTRLTSAPVSSRTSFLSSLRHLLIRSRRFFSISGFFTLETRPQSSYWECETDKLWYKQLTVEQYSQLNLWRKIARDISEFLFCVGYPTLHIQCA